MCACLGCALDVVGFPMFLGTSDRASSGVTLVSTLGQMRQYVGVLHGLYVHAILSHIAMAACILVSLKYYLSAGGSPLFALSASFASVLALHVGDYDDVEFRAKTAVFT